MTDEDKNREKAGREKRGRYFDTFIRILAGLLAAAGPQGLKIYGPEGFAKAIRLVGLHKTQIGLALLIMLAGIGAYFFKQMTQQWYGFVEAIFGGSAVVAVALGISPGSATPAQWATLVGSAYVIARGLNNWAEATGGNNRTLGASFKMLRRLT
ncbi:MAG: hypothetical protein ABSG16_21840 [Candidatus Acidiferrum sp.]|jgi:hypothetical protein